MWPNKKQWNNWSLPSKLTAIGTFVSFLSFLFSIVVFVVQELEVSQEPTNSYLFKYNYFGDEYSCKAGDVCRELNTLLPFMVLPKPSAIVYKTPQLETREYSPIKLRSYWPLYLFNIKSLSSGVTHEGWYQIGVTTQSPIGWIQAKHIIEWKQRIIVNFILGRKSSTNSIVMFKSLHALERTLEGNGINPNTYGVDSEVYEVSLPYSIVDTWSIVPILDFKECDTSSGVPGKCLKVMPEAFRDQTNAYFSNVNQPVWIFDRDFDNSEPIIEVQILLRRKELELIKQAAAIILRQAQTGSVSPNGFYQALRSLVAQASNTTDIDLSKVAISNGSTSKLLDKLPYKSTTAAIDDESFSVMSADQQDQFMDVIERKKKLYDELLGDPRLWKPLNEDDPPEEFVYALPLHLLM